MSRSYRKNLIRTDHGPSTWWFKRQASKTIRRVPLEETIPNGGIFKRYFEPWTICDYKFTYDPSPIIYSYGGRIRVIEPDPLYRWRNK